MVAVSIAVVLTFVAIAVDGGGLLELRRKSQATADAAALAAAYMNLCIAHIQGGEVSGSIDESARHAISKFAHYHFPSTARSAAYLQRMGERPDTILAIGCPSSDIARCLDCTLTPEWSTPMAAAPISTSPAPSC